MSAVINPTSAVAQVAAASQATPQLVLQPGTVIDARVLAVRENLARILIAGLSLDVLTEVALQPGANLKLAVSQTADGVRLAIVPQDAAARGQGPSSALAGRANASTSPAAAANSAVSNAGTTAQANLPRVAAASLVPAAPEAIAISQAVQTAAPRQASLAPLFANLPVIVASDGVPQQVQKAASTLLATRPPLDATLTAGDLRQAFQKSGLFLEATLARGAAPQGSPDLKAALVVFKQVLTNWLGQAAPAAPSVPATPPAATLASVAASQPLPQGVPQNPRPTQATMTTGLPIATGLVPDPAVADVAVHGQVLRQTAETPVELQELQTRVAGSAPTVARERPEPAGDGLRIAAQALTRDAASAPGKAETQPADAAVAKPATHQPSQMAVPRHTSEPAPPFRGAMPSAQPIAMPSFASDTQRASVGHQLLEQTDAALARQTLLQVASLPDRVDLGGGNQTTQPRWSFEIPFATPQGTAMAQFEISRDGGNDVEAAAPTRVWRARFTLDVEPAGPVHALVSLIGEKTAVRMWAERPETAAQLRAGTEALSDALRQAALEPGDILIGEGAPPQPKPRAGRFLDRAT